MKKYTLNHEIIRYPEDFKENHKELWKEINSVLCKKYTGNKGQAKINQTIFAFDSETTNFIDPKTGEKKPYVFSLMTTIMNPYSHKNVNILCRTISDYLEFMDLICDSLDTKINRIPKKDKFGVTMLDEAGNIMYDEQYDKYINVYVHNLPFDIQFLISHLYVYKVFASKMHKPYYVVAQNGIKFMDTVVLTQKTLNELSKSLQHFDDRKMVGDFDYNLLRNSKTTFSEKEKGYVTEDTVTLAAFIDEEMDEWDNQINKIPLTLTGKVRRFIEGVMKGKKQYIKELYDANILPYALKQQAKIYLNRDEEKEKDDDKKKDEKFIKKLVGESGGRLKLTANEYKLMHRAYIGGFTHASPLHAGKVMHDVQSWDFTSSYPTRFLAEKFACSEGFRVQGEDGQKFINDMKKHIKDNDRVYVFDFSADYISSKIDYEYYWSSSKFEKVDKDTLLEYNGRVKQARNIKTSMTSIDWETFEKVYDFGNPHFSNIYAYKLDYLPRGVILAVLYFYNQKTKLKGIVGRERDYQRGKGLLNSLYGLSVTDNIYKDIINYKQKYSYSNWVKEKVSESSQDFMDRIKRYNNDKRRTLFYLWGIQISAYSRRDLWKGIMECKSDYCYSDTDSIKVINSQNHKDFINSYNNEIIDKINKCLSHYKLDKKLARPLDIKGNSHQLGVWDPNDGFYSHFKTLGAKRYIDISKDSKSFEITIAGLSKKAGAKYMLDNAKVNYTLTKEGYKLNSLKNIDKLFDMFNDQLYVPAKYTGKLAHYYIDHFESFEVTDYQGNTDLIPAGSGCLLQPIDFTLSVSRQNSEFLLRFVNGFVEQKEKSGFIE